MFGTDYSEIWLGYADNSYIATRLLWFTGFMIEAPINAHRTIELYLKSYLVGRGVRIKKDSSAWGHRIGDLCQEAVKIDASFDNENLNRRVRFFERYFDYVRYPSEQGSPDDGSLTWFSFDSNILPLDEVVAFIRPRIKLKDDNWASTTINRLLSDRSKAQPHQLRAIEESNYFLKIINTDKTWQSDVEFNENFEFDKPGC